MLFLCEYILINREVNPGDYFNVWEVGNALQWKKRAGYQIFMSVIPIFNFIFIIYLVDPFSKLSKP